jgi:hypothetical protein
MEDERLSPELAAMLARLRHEVAPGPEEEEHTVRALRRRGLLPPRPGAHWRRWVLPLAQMAAALALFAAGTLYGRYRATNRQLETLLAQHDQDVRTAALLVQRAGTAYVDALVRLAALQAKAPTDSTLAGGREAAAATLRAAAAQVERVAPNAALTAELRGAQASMPPRTAANVHWF